MAGRKNSEEEEELGSALPDVKVGEPVDLVDLDTSSHETKPPARYTEPQLVAKLEELGIGRPATYADIVSKNQERDYVHKKGGAMYPTWMGMWVAQALEGELMPFVDYKYTARMDEELDHIQEGKLAKNDFLAARWAEIDKDVNGLIDKVKADPAGMNKYGVIDLHNGYQVRCRKAGKGGTEPLFLLEDPNGPPDENGYLPSARLNGDELADGLDADTCRRLIEDARHAKQAKPLTAPAGPYEGMLITLRTGKYGGYAHAEDPTGARQPVNISLPKGKSASRIKPEEVLALFKQEKLPRDLGDGYKTGISKRGKAYIMHTKPAGAKARPARGRRRYANDAEFADMPAGLDPYTITLEQARQAFIDQGKDVERTDDAAGDGDATGRTATRRTTGAARKRTTRRTAATKRD